MWVSKILKVDLSTASCQLLDPPETGRRYLGGRGFNIWYLYHRLKKGIDPLSEDNMLLLSCGLLTGSAAPVSARLHINSLSPLTGILGSSNIGGYAGAWLRSCNIASVIIQGRSDHPVYLHINQNGACLKDASHLKGKDAFDTQALIQQAHHDEKLKILAIGPAGETGIRFASIISGHDHAAGRTGMGTVMGAKKLKAIVIVKGSYKHLPADTPVKKKAVKTYIDTIKNADEFDFFSTYGGAGYVKWVNDFGIMGSRNYQQIGITDIKNIDARKLKQNVVRKSGCSRCPIQCKADLDIKVNGNYTRFTRPEFEPMINLGPKCGLDDLKQIVALDNLCSRMGMDTTSTASVIAFAMALFEKQLLPEKLISSLDLSWGNFETMETLIHQMVENKGLGKILRNGVKKAVEVLGPATHPHAIHVKGLELTAYHPMAIMGTALGYAVSSRGGDYNNVYASLEYSWSREQAKKEFGTSKAVDIHSFKAKGKVIKKAVLTNIIVDSLGLCKVPVLSLLQSFNLEKEAELVTVLSGQNMDSLALFSIAEKIAALEKLFNIRYAEDDIKDRLPEVLFKQQENHQKFKRQFENMIQEYYHQMGWDENGIPSDVDMKK